ncbi:MAG: DNA primase [Candidatus Omnitrophota bacterium]
MEVKEQVKSRVSITDVVGLYINLKPSGKYFKALCPFHTEKTPSFYVMPEKDTFACYGCNKFGDIFTFIQEIENISFTEALKLLVDKFNIPIDKKYTQQHGKKDEYVGINEWAMKYFRTTLLESTEGKKAKEYLEKRGISKTTEELFGLGYAENRWDGLYTFLKKKSVNIEKCIELGLLVKNDKNRIYDRFRGRIIFPIFSESGTPIAFGGRTIFDEPNKYLNSPDTPLYKKSNHLYAFYHSKKAIREKKHAVLVEGYFDAVSLYQNRVENVAASLGTALTDNQIYLLKRFSERIYIFYDSDKAGIEAAVRGIEKMFEQNINPGIISLKDAKDPDDFIREKGPDAFQQLIDHALDGFKFLLHHMSKKYDCRIPERKNDAISEIVHFIEKISEPIIRNEYLQMTADFFKVDEITLKLKSKKKASPTPAITHKRLDITLAERVFLESILAAPMFIGELKSAFNRELLSVLSSGNIIRLLLDHYAGEALVQDDFRKVTETLSDAERGEFLVIFEKAKSIPKELETLEKQIESCYLEFQNMLNKQDIRHLNQQIKIAEKNNNIELIEKLIKDKYDFIQSQYKNDRRSS